MLLPMLLVVVDSVAQSAEVENMDCCWGDHTIDHPCPNAIHCPISLIHSKSKDNFSSYHGVHAHPAQPGLGTSMSVHQSSSLFKILLSILKEG
jgi:hypothetical protein